MKVTGNTIFISGGSAGIGLAIAKKLPVGEAKKPYAATLCCFLQA